MMKKVILILSCLFISVGLIYSQTITVRGTVVDDAGIEVVGASVVVKGTTTGVATDIDGNFSLNAPEKSTLVFTLVGMKKLEMKAAPEMRVVMEADEALLEEVVVTGYGTMKKSTFTGSASVLSTEKLENVPSLGLEAKLAGAAAGVRMGAATGQPGAVESIRIRGAGSIMASNEPLYVIDGVPVQSGNASEFEYAEAGSNILSTINSNDIENITIIKDAGAAALYGSRAANGVIVITTKSGKVGKPLVTLRANWGFTNSAVDYRPTLNGADRRELLKLGLENKVTDDPSVLIDKEGNVSTPVEWVNSYLDAYASEPWSGWTNWKDELMRTGKQTNYEATVQGGNDKMTIFSSIAYAEQEGITKASDYTRVTGRLNASYKGIQNLHLNFSGMFSNTKQSVYGEGTGFSSPIMAVSMTTSPSDFPYHEDGSINISEGFLALGYPKANPIHSMNLNYDRNEMDRFLGSVNAKYDIWNGLYAYQNISYDLVNIISNVWWDPRSDDGEASQGVLQKIHQRMDQFVSQSRIGFTNTFGKHSVDAIVGYEVEKYKKDMSYMSGEKFANPSKQVISASEIKDASAEYEENRMISYLASLNYNYDNKYYLGTSFRRDGSSKFRRSDRWGNFWSVAGSWRLTQESFAESMTSIVNDAKVRASYGVNGNLPFDNYAFKKTYEYGHYYNGRQGARPPRLAYEELTWEQNKSFNVGLDFTLFNRLDFVIDWYTRNTENLLLPFSLSQTSGFNNIVMNRGKINNQGIEVAITSRNVMTKDFTWTTSFNISHNKNELKWIDEGVQEMAGVVGHLRHIVGNPFSQFYVYEYAGVDPTTGKESFYTNKGENPREITTDITKAARISKDKVDPVVSGGITNNFTYKDFDLGFTLTYSLGGHLFDGASYWLGTDGGGMQYSGNIPSYYKIGDVWKEEGDIAKLPRYVRGNVSQRYSSRWIHSTNHLRLKNITLGYSLPKKMLREAGLSNVRLYASAANLFTIKSGDLPVDPEIPVSNDYGVRDYGVVYYQTPPLRVVTFGVEVTF